MRLIDADALFYTKQLEPMGNGQYEETWIIHKDDIDNAPTIDEDTLLAYLLTGQEGKVKFPIKTDLISRADAIEAVCEWGTNEERNGNLTMTMVSAKQNIVDILSALPSAEAEPTVIRSKTLLPTKDFKEWAKRIKEVNPNAVVIPCDAEVASAEAVQGEWIKHKGEWVDFDFYPTKYECNQCHYYVDEGYDSIFCPNCGARMKGGAE